MKRALAFILLMIIIFCSCGCAHTAGTATANFYYCAIDPDYHTQSSIIQSELRKVETNLSDLEGVLSLYFDGPVSNRLESPFPAGTKLKTAQPGKDITAIVLSDHISTLSGVELMIACACLATTVMEITQADIVQIRAETALLDNQEFLEFSAQSLLSFS